LRVQLIRRAAAALLLLLGGTARAEDSFVAKTQVYADSDHTVVVSPLVRMSKDVWRGGTVGAGFVADAVSSASVDVVTNATKQMTDLRKELSASLSQQIADTNLSAAYLFSLENDYLSHNVHLGAAQDLFQKNTTLALGWTLNLNDVGRSGDPTFHRSLTVNFADVSLTQVFGPKTVGQLSYTFQYADGYQASPYRFVRVEASPEFKLPETEPGTRLRHAVVVGVHRHVGQDSALQADYRLYLDSWGVVSHTVQLRLLTNFGRLTLRLRERFYYQSAASFFQPHYLDDTAPFVTADRELSTFWSDLLGIKLSYRFRGSFEGLSIEAKVDGFYFSYLDFAWLSDRVGANVELGLSLVY
jgi:hypothetical protein